MPHVPAVEQYAAHGLDEKASAEWTEDHTGVVALAAQYVPGSDAEKKLLRKIDFRIIVG